MTVRIVTDSSCDLPQAMADALGIRIVPLSVRFGDTEYIDRTTITATEKFSAPGELEVLGGPGGDAGTSAGTAPKIKPPPGQ